MPEEVLTRIYASRPRRAFGVGVLATLGMLMIYVGLAFPAGDLMWQVFLLVFGAVMLWFASKMWRATSAVIELTETELRTSDGVVIARVDQIRSLDRGTFAFKPSNGFILRLDAKAPRAWYPGLWWRMGRRVGVGGVTSAAQTKAMAEIIAAMNAERQE
ncbi:hypothetical protein MNBD_ALPHA07-1210 [hydrothermal vent metagenome]|uniref:PH domain-containing protein n=1 Tax=hydrothermal vent metagenome TaxID=652676 RepID=A0A3B0S4J4_9ZZZZ